MVSVTSFTDVAVVVTSQYGCCWFCYTIFCWLFVLYYLCLILCNIYCRLLFASVFCICLLFRDRPMTIFIILSNMNIQLSIFLVTLQSCTSLGLTRNLTKLAVKPIKINHSWHLLEKLSHMSLVLMVLKPSLLFLLA